ncbi:MAG: segregation/condensation protein A [Halothiobacillaceae bacterium]|nr:segregation/condensation protein A [Halothiobacillaceae bacterium]
MPSPDSAERLTPVAVARLRGETLTELPADLYIPPDALEVCLEDFEGPLDLLLYLIRRQNLDILDIPIAEVTRQYLGYIEMMRQMRLELAAEYLLMAAWLAEIKSRMLLPRPPVVEGEGEEDPRQRLVERLLEYEKLARAAETLDALPRAGRDVHEALAEPPPLDKARPLPEVSLDELVSALREALSRAALVEHHHIQREALSVRARMSEILARLADCPQGCAFQGLLEPGQGRRGVVVSFLAVLELLKAELVRAVQDRAFDPIHLHAVTGGA